MDLETVNEPAFVITAQPELSKWRCHLFGSAPEGGNGLVWYPAVGSVPNFLVRWLSRVFFGCTWIKDQ